MIFRKESLNGSFPRKRESRKPWKFLDARFRGHDDLRLDLNFLSVGRILLCAALLLAARTGIAAEALTLDEYYAHALKRSEVVAIQSELIAQAEERYRQARAATGPSVSGVAAETWQDSGARDTAAYPTRQPASRITASQPIFRGFREFAALRQNRALIDAQSQDYRQAQVQLFRDVAQNFYDVIALEQELENLAEQIEQNLERQKELQQRVRIGRSRASEILTVQATISTLRALVEQLRGGLSASREVFSFLSGLPADTPLQDTEALPTDLAPLDDYLARIEQRPDVRAAAQRVLAAEENIAIARGERLPTVDLVGNRYLERTGTLADVEWDVQLALTIPLYTGGAIKSRIRQAESQSKQAELTQSQARRLADQEIRALYQGVLFDRMQVEALTAATEAARKNYAAQQRDYRLGLVTNLEVLQALATYQENLRALDRARYTAKLDYLRLQAASVRRPESIEGPLP